MNVYPLLTLEHCKRLFAGAVIITAICAQYTTLLMAQPEWNDGETAALVDYLDDHHSEAEEAGNFKQQVLTSAAEHINNNETLQSTSQIHVIEKYHNQTGVHWDNETGTGIEGPAAAAVWTLYIKDGSIIPLDGTRGCHIFHPGGAAPSITNPDSDLAVTGPSSAAAMTTSITSTTAAHFTTMSPTTGSVSVYSTAASTTAGSNISKQPYSDMIEDIETITQNSCMTKMSSAAKAVVIMLAATVVEIQGTINQLTDVFEWFVRGESNAKEVYICIKVDW
ncbi:hypothetical protein BDR05DRAFT_950309 [Suillus weaverae]|nr:hypothetical protein BDR05DRAFT_950309 [Suillus weaverae]